MIMLVFAVKTLHIILNPSDGNEEPEGALEFERIFMSWLALEQSQIVDPNSAVELFNYAFMDNTINLSDFQIIGKLNN